MQYPWSNPPYIDIISLTIETPSLGPGRRISQKENPEIRPEIINNRAFIGRPTREHARQTTGHWLPRLLVLAHNTQKDNRLRLQSTSEGQTGQGKPAEKGRVISWSPTTECPSSSTRKSSKLWSPNSASEITSSISNNYTTSIHFPVKAAIFAN